MSRVEVFEDRIELQCESASIMPIRSSDPASFQCYPLPKLEPSGRFGPVSLPVVILENPYLRLTFAPSLGGRLLYAFDRRTQTNALRRRPQLTLSPEWPRGAGLDDGIVPIVGRALGTLGSVDFTVRQWEDGSASFIAHNLEVADDWSWHATWTLLPDAARIQLSFRALNRSRRFNSSGIGLSFGGSAEACSVAGGFATRNFDDDSVWFANAVSGPSFTPVVEYDSVAAYYLLPGDPAAPRQTVSFKIDVSPFSCPGELVGVSESAAAWIANGRLHLQVDRPRRGSRIFLLTESDQTLESSIDLFPEHRAEFDLTTLGNGVREILVRSESGENVLRCHAAPLEFEASAVGTSSGGLPEPVQLWPSATVSPTHRAIAWNEGALEATRVGNWELAIDRIDEALLYAGDDHIAWWLRAVIERRAGISESDSLTNAHYLAPLEPLLRVESFLRQPPGGSEPSAIIRPIGQNADALLEGALRLIDAGLDDDAVRWIDEALRHQDLALLRYFAAWRLGAGASKVAEAAIHVRAAEALPSDLPLPHGPTSWACIDWLTNRFPDSSRLKELSALSRALLEVTD